MTILTFGSRNLTPKHLPAMRRHTSLEALGEVFGAQWDGIENLLLIHGDGPPGKEPLAIGADKLATVAASLEWPPGWRCRPFPPQVREGVGFAQAAKERNRALVDQRPDFSLCFHTDPKLGRGSAHTAALLRHAGLWYRKVLMDHAGNVLSVEDVKP